MKIRRYDLFYVAGFFDGEGAIMFPRRQGTVRLTVAVSQNTIQVPNLHVKWFGGHVYSYTPPKRSDTTIYQWKVTGNGAVAFLEQVIPMLIIKKVQAIDAVTVWLNRNNPEVSDPIIQRWKEFQNERRRRIAEAKARSV